MISKEKLIQILIRGRMECYIKKSSEYNPYVRSQLYDWEFKLPIEEFVFTDAYRGFNPYSGVEYVYESLDELPVWSCDYVGYVNQNPNIASEKVYEFLKEARGAHLKNYKENLFSDYRYKNGFFRYETRFQGDVASMLQIEDFFYEDILVAQQITAGRLKE